MQILYRTIPGLAGLMLLAACGQTPRQASSAKPVAVRVLTAQRESVPVILEAPGTVPVGSATISQTVRIPTLDQVRRPHLRFWYRVLTYDVTYSQRLQRYVDALEVTL